MVANMLLESMPSYFFSFSFSFSFFFSRYR